MSNYQENADWVALLDANGVQQEKLQAELSKFKAVSNPGNLGTAGAAKANLSGWTFQTTYETEVRRFTKFVNGQQDKLELSAKALFLKADGVATGTRQMQIRSVEESFAMVHDLKRETKKMVEDCLALQRFYTVSRKILLDFASMADEKLRGVVNCTKLLFEILPKSHINSSLVCIISDTFHALRQAEDKITNQGGSGGDDLWEAPSSFKRVTTKYWVKDENLTSLMLTCAAEAPLLVYGKKGPLTSTNRSDLKVAEGDKLWDTLATKITSIYFDSADMYLYKHRLARAEGAQLLRARWYGPKMPTSDKVIFLELKTHHEKWVNQKSVKERATIKEGDMMNFLLPVRWTKEDAQQMVLRGKPNMKAEEIPKATDLLMRMHNLVEKHKITACVRSLYDRAAFQSATNNDLRLTLDRTVTVVNEREQQPGEGQWCLNDADAQTAQAKVVPYNVFEVKLAGNDFMPAGLAAAQSDSTMELATKFSKFTTGAAVFNSVSTLPYWAAHPSFYSFFELDKRFARSDSGDSMDSFEDAYNLMGSSNETLSGNLPLPKGVKIAPKFPARIEPKTYFANERTFVQWISASILLLNISGYLLSANSNYNATAAAISFSAFVLVVYSTGLYFKRLGLLKVRKPYGYFNRVNPIFMTSVVGLAIFLIWTDSVQGSDFLGMFSSSSEGGGDDRRLLQNCPQDVIGTNLLIKENPSSLELDFKRHSFLMTSADSVYMQPLNNDGSVPSKADSLIQIKQSHLQGLTTVGDRLFTVSGGPERTELIEMAWWGPRVGNERLRVVGRWTLDDSRSQIDGFGFVSSSDTTSTGSFCINMNSSMQVYSVPSRSENGESDQPSHPMRLKSLNMKVLTHGVTAGSNESQDRLMTMTTFEGITYILKSNVLEAWNLTDGTLFADIELPASDEDSAIGQWTDFALERRRSTDTPNVRGADVPFSDSLVLHLMTDSASGGRIWSFPVFEMEGQSGLFSVPDCQLGATSVS